MPPWQGLAELTGRADLSPEYFKLTFRAPEIARGAAPGLFVNLKVDAPELCLRRPISIHGVRGDEVDLLVGVHGAGTRWLRERQVGERLDLLGPLGGRGLSIAPAARRVALVGGGVGIPPLRFLAERARGTGVESTAFVGARNSDRLLGVEDFMALGVSVVTSTDDGSAGFHGTAVQALEAHLADQPVDQILSCGPTPMMRAVAELALARGIPCEVCLEARMACAVGACLSCVVETKVTGWQRYQRVCTEGPVFDAGSIVWETLSPLCAL